MKTYIKPDKTEWSGITARPAIDRQELFPKVRQILKEVKNNGDQALLKFTREFDGAELSSLKVENRELEAANNLVDEKLKFAIARASENIKKFHQAQRESPQKIETTAGVTCWRKSVPIEKVGLYIPGGSAPLFSTVLMLGIPAQIAGCRELVLCTPPDKNGNIHPAILFAAKTTGIAQIHKVGGAQAIAAMAYGTESIPKVDKIFGPGNQYVTAAKQLTQLEGTAIDMPAGPSEVLIYADDTCEPAFVAADLLSQAEHGADSQVILVTNSEKLADQIRQEVQKQVQDLPRKTTAEAALQNSSAVIFGQQSTAIEFINEYAPEHLILAVENYREVAENIINAGSVFLGNYTPESAGDYASGTNHTLPTNGFARAYSGVSLDSFVKKITFQEITKEGLEKLGDTIETMAAAEELMAHKNAVSIRRNNS